MNPIDPSSPLGNSMPQLPSQVAEKASSAMDTAREKLESARDTAREKFEAVRDTTREKLESARDSARETMHVAREKVEHAGSSLLHWTRENPATALATVFASGFVIGCALTLGRHHERTFGQRLSDDPMATLRDAMRSALEPLRDGLYSAADSARSATENVVDRVTHSQNGHAVANRLRELGDNLKFW
jgi:ElaB/YqjD/DUF883 family membrane-anchored ribosome-binding protein